MNSIVNLLVVFASCFLVRTQNTYRNNYYDRDNRHHVYYNADYRQQQQYTPQTVFNSPNNNVRTAAATTFVKRSRPVERRAQRRTSSVDVRPHRPVETRRKNFKIVFDDIDRRAEPDTFSASDEEIDSNDDFNGRSIVSPGQYPHMAALGYRTRSREIEFKCGGSLISEFFVLTAAHCCYFGGRKVNIVKIGDIRLKEREAETRPQRRRVVNIILHPLYTSSLHYHDIALLQLNRPTEYTRFVRPIRLWALDEIPYSKVFTMGYGSTSFAQAQTNILTELDLSIVPLDRCNRTMPADDGAPEGIVESQICAQDFISNRDTCQGDSGGPLQLNLERRRRRKRLRYYLVGITSYGTVCRSSNPGIYTRVSSYIDWIASIVWPNYFNYN